MRELFSQDAAFSVEETEGEGKTLTGTAVKYDVLTSSPRKDAMSGKYIFHKIEKGSLDEAFTKSDFQVSMVLGHDVNKPMASTSNGTLKLTQTEEGIDFSANIANVSYANDAWTLIKRGDLSKMSFGINVAKDGYSDAIIDGIPTRTITKAERIYEISPVLFPAFSETSIAAYMNEDPEFNAEKPEEDNETPKTYKSKKYRLKNELLNIKKII